MNDWFEVQEIEEGLWAIREPRHAEDVISYLIMGSERSILFDTGMGIANIQEIVEGLTQSPILVVNSHSHYDHVGDNFRFQNIAIHRSEARNLKQEVDAEFLAGAMAPDMFRPYPPEGFDPEGFYIQPSKATQLLKEGDSLSLGDRTLEVIHTPGHSPGSICLWEPARGLLFTGDTLYDGPIYAQLPGSDFDAYQDSLDRLCLLVPQTRLLLPSHNATPLEPEFVLHITQVFQKITQGGVKYWFEDMPWGRTRVYKLDDTIIYVK